MTPARILRRFSVGFLFSLAALACTKKEAAPAGDPAPNASTGQVLPTSGALAELRAFDRALRDKALGLPPAPSTQSLGANPYRICALADGRHFAGLLRGRDELVVLDAELETLARVPAPDLPSALVVSEEGDVFVAGELSSQIRVYRWQGRLEAKFVLDLDDVRGIRGVAVSGQVLYAVEEHDGRLISVDLRRVRGGRDTVVKLASGAPGRFDRQVGHGLFGVRRVGRHLLVHSLLEHALIGFELDAQGLPEREAFRIVHDGPIWAYDALADERWIWALLGGVEDRPLERRDGVFGYVDSFVYLYRIGLAEGVVERLRAVNVSELGVLTPKAVALARSEDGVFRGAVSGYGSARRAELVFEGGVTVAPQSEVFDFLPGVADAARLDDGTQVFADPLLDSWLRLRDGEVTVRPENGLGREQTPQSKLGEALFFTTLIAPWNESEGRLSRFTCETCHFEGYVDGRVHYTGRDDHRVSTKPLLGLYNNRPYFSRALDPDLSAVSHHEFRVAARGNYYDPWFSIRLSEFPWLSQLGISAPALSALELRKALLAFLMEFTHAPNPLAFGRSSFLTEEDRGAELFRDRCERCHAARTASDEPLSRVPFERWEELIFSANAPLVWARGEYERTGVLPYLHERGTRVPSLRRLYKKWPYFTNGSAKSLPDVLSRARFSEDRFFHDRAPFEGSLSSLGAEDRAALLAFLRLL